MERRRRSRRRKHPTHTAKHVKLRQRSVGRRGVKRRGHADQSEPDCMKEVGQRESVAEGRVKWRARAGSREGSKEQGEEKHNVMIRSGIEAQEAAAWAEGEALGVGVHSMAVKRCVHGTVAACRSLCYYACHHAC